MSAYETDGSLLSACRDLEARRGWGMNCDALADVTPKSCAELMERLREARWGGESNGFLLDCK
ncbi:hypothetical protein Acy02nite_72090 [Actinoplanes cyaneus]|uniref:Uncharacterized protein n=1 Tax=Actinoplanes cyaneus TaxID=52696 RepID=A0A919ITI2_9ACTN|nr:hypothetical protein [Actinoplanes cyaneus]GID69328.1 hypothetical protein Acy02nite_72090 [Actinoplanes cyaneus]